MERKERRIVDYFSAEEIRQRGKELQQRIEEDPTKDRFNKVVEEGMVGAAHEFEAMLVSLARLSLLAPAMRAILLIHRKIKKFTFGPTSQGAE